MATSRMIDEAMHKPGRPVGTQMAGASSFTVHRSPADEETAEFRAAGRTAVRLILGGHDCSDLPACPAHGQTLCGCNPCAHERHAADVEVLTEALQAIGVAGVNQVTHRACTSCGSPRPLSRFTRDSDTCKECQTARKNAEEATDHDA